MAVSVKISMCIQTRSWTEEPSINPLTAVSNYIVGFHLFISKLNTSFKNVLQIKCKINQQECKIIQFRFVKSV